MTVTTALALSLLAGLSIPMGAVIASSEVTARFCRERGIDSFVTYFGGGALLAAIALVLVPDGMEGASLPTALLSFLAGGVLFWRLSAWLTGC